MLVLLADLVLLELESLTSIAGMNNMEWKIIFKYSGLVPFVFHENAL